MVPYTTRYSLCCVWFWFAVEIAASPAAAEVEEQSGPPAPPAPSTEGEERGGPRTPPAPSAESEEQGGQRPPPAPSAEGEEQGGQRTPPAPSAEGEEQGGQRTPPVPSAESEGRTPRTPRVSAGEGPPAETRMALAATLLGRQPQSVEEADEALARAGFQVTPRRSE